MDKKITGRFVESKMASTQICLMIASVVVFLLMLLLSLYWNLKRTENDFGHIIEHIFDKPSLDVYSILDWIIIYGLPFLFGLSILVFLVFSIVYATRRAKVTLQKDENGFMFTFEKLFGKSYVCQPFDYEVRIAIIPIYYYNYFMSASKAFLELKLYFLDKRKIVLIEELEKESNPGFPIASKDILYSEDFKSANPKEKPLMLMVDMLTNEYKKPGRVSQQALGSESQKKIAPSASTEDKNKPQNPGAIKEHG